MTRIRDYAYVGAVDVRRSYDFAKFHIHGPTGRSLFDPKSVAGEKFRDRNLWNDLTMLV
jgi:hypothetical protein